MRHAACGSSTTDPIDAKAHRCSDQFLCSWPPLGRRLPHKLTKNLLRYLGSRRLSEGTGSRVSYHVESPYRRIADHMLKARLSIDGRSAKLRGCARVVRWRRSSVSRERDAERACRAITHAFGHLGYAESFPPQQVLRQGHAPAQEVFHRRNADFAPEPVEKCRA